MKLLERLKNMGPAALIAAAFIGPGTITTCTLAGAKHGLTLLWALLFSTIASIILQEMAARIGVVTQAGLAENIRNHINHPFAKAISILLVIGAIYIGNAAYESGNILGAYLGVIGVAPGIPPWIIVGAIGIIAGLLLWIGSYRAIEAVLVALVILMSLCFLLTTFMLDIDFRALLSGLFLPRINNDNILLVMGLVGTTVVPYNLFLHAALVNEKWDKPTIKTARSDIYISIGLGGIISMCVLICASGVQQGAVENAAGLARGLEPLLVNYALIAISIGLMAAGITSAITAPLATAYAISGILGWPQKMKSMSFRGLWMSILIIGVTIASQGWNPIYVIKFAQVANGLLLPSIVIFIVWLINKKEVMGDHTNSVIQNLLSYIVLGIVILLAGKTFYNLF